MAITEVDKSLAKGFAGNSGERQKREWPHKHWGFMVGLGGLEPPTSPLSGARSSHLSYRPQHRGGTLHKYLIVRWFNVFRKCAESSLRYKTATFPIHLLCTIANSRFRPSWNIQPTKRQDVLAKLESAMFWPSSNQQTEPQCGSLEDILLKGRALPLGN